MPYIGQPIGHPGSKPRPGGTNPNADPRNAIVRPAGQVATPYSNTPADPVLGGILGAVAGGATGLGVLGALGGTGVGTGAIGGQASFKAPSGGGGGGAGGNGINAPPMSLYKYNSNYGNANQTENMYARMGTNAGLNPSPTVRDPRATQNLTNENNINNQYGNLDNYYQGILSGKAPSLAQMQLNAATDQAIAAQQSAANSARGPLAGALAQRTAQNNETTLLQQNAQNAAQARIQEEQAAALGLGGALNNQGQFTTAEQGLSQNMGITQAQLQEQQNQLNQQGQLAYANLGQQTALSQLQAGEEYGNALLAAQGQGTQLAEFNAQQQNDLWNRIIGSVGSAGGSALASIGGGGGSTGSDVKLREPGGGSAMTLREEPGFLLLRNDRTGELAKVATQPLSPAEHRQAMAPHGAGPLGSRTGPGYLYAGDLDVGGGDDTGALASAMQESVGAANAMGNYTPDAGTPTGIAGVLAGSDLAGRSGPNYGKLIGQGLQQAGGAMMQNGQQSAGPTNIPGLPAADDPSSYGVQAHGSNASQQVINVAAKIALMAAIAG